MDAKGNYTRYVRAFGGKYPSHEVLKREFKILGWKLYKAGITFNKRNPVVLGMSVNNEKLKCCMCYEWYFG